MAFSGAIAPRRLETSHSLSVSLCKELGEGIGGGEAKHQGGGEGNNLPPAHFPPPLNLLGLHMSLWAGMRT